MAWELCRAKGKHECCETHYTGALWFGVDAAIQATLSVLDCESHSTCFRSHKEVCIYGVPGHSLIKALHGDCRRIELFNIAHASTFPIAREAGALN